MRVQADRVRRHTGPHVLRRIEDETERRLAAVADDPQAMDRRLAELDREWDVDRVIETEAALLGLVGVALAALVSRRFLKSPLLTGGGMLLYALTGRYLTMPLIRRLGVRTAHEIARERYALLALRGDFAATRSAPGTPPLRLASFNPRPAPAGPASTHGGSR